jgi:hypothetical protein
VSLQEEVILTYVCDGPHHCGQSCTESAIDGWDYLLSVMLRDGWTEVTLAGGERGLLCPKCSEVTR